MMNRLEYWLLDSVVTTPVPLSWLTAANLPMLMNRSAHGASLDRLIATFLDLSKQGYVGIYRHSDFNAWQDAPRAPDRAELHAALTNQRDASYALTVAGGQHWEAVSQPRWQNYFVKYETDITQIEAGSRPHIQTYLDLYSYLQGAEAIAPESVTWRVEQTWRATYWKTLPVGYHVTFQVVPKEAEAVPRWAWARWHALSTWYTNPFEDTSTTI